LISPLTIQSIIDACRVEEVVGDFVSLKKRGVNYIGLCPFHNEKTPSFTVSPTKGIYKCFGCGKAGNSVNFIMDHEHYNYPEALRYLAQKYNIEIEEKELTPNELKQLNEREALLHITDFAQKFFTDNLFNSEEGKAIGLSYFKERGFYTDIIRKFQLGYSVEKFNDFSDAAIKAGYNSEYLVKSGISIKNDEGVIYDRFRARVIFPIHNLSGKVIGFTARILSSDKSKAKYVNSPESEIYNKSKTLYGIFFAKNSIVANDMCYLVEGNTDVISLYQAGVENVVASSGTSLTADQIKLIKRFTRNITILYDGDAAGIKASLRGVDMILEEGLNVKIVLFPDGDDPDSFAKKNSPTELTKYIKDNSSDFIKFKVKLLYSENANDPLKKASLIKEIVNTISLIPDSITRSIYIKECSKLMEVQEQLLINEINKILYKNINKQNSFEIQPSIETIPEEEIKLDTEEISFEPQERYIIELLLNFGNINSNIDDFDDEGNPIEINKPTYKVIIEILNENNIEFTTPVYSKFIDEFNKIISENIVPDEKYFAYHNDKDISALAIEIYTSKYSISKNWKDLHKINIPSYSDEDSDKLINGIKGSIISLKIKIIEKKKNNISNYIKEANSKGNMDDVILLTQEFLKNMEDYKRLNIELGRIITK